MSKVLNQIERWIEQQDKYFLLGIFDFLIWGRKKHKVEGTGKRRYLAGFNFPYSPMDFLDLPKYLKENLCYFDEFMDDKDFEQFRQFVGDKVKPIEKWECFKGEK